MLAGHLEMSEVSYTRKTVHANATSLGGDTMSGHQYNNLRNKAMKDLRKANKRYISNLSKAPNTKQFWSVIKSLNGCNST